VCAIVVALSCLPGLASAQGSVDRRAVVAFINAYVEARNTGNLTAFVEMHAQRLDLLMVDNGEVKRGWDTVRNEAEKMAYPITIGNVTVFALSDDSAIAVVPFTVGAAATQGQPGPRGTMSLVLQQTPKGLRIVHGHTSLVRQ
jgi:hypothetical protein